MNLSLQAHQIMTRSPATLHPATTVAEARRKLRVLGIRHLPVVAAEQGLIGIVSVRDLASRTDTRWSPTVELPDKAQRAVVASIMTQNVRVARPSTPVSEIARWMVQHHIGAVPVVDDETNPSSVVGIVSYEDILRSLAW